MHKTISTVFLAFFALIKLSAQPEFKGSLIMGLTLGLNSPYKNTNTGSYQFLTFDSMGQLRTLQQNVSASTLLPPLSFGADLMLTNRLGLSMNAMYQSHIENWSVKDVATNEILNYWEQKQKIKTISIGFKGIWLLRDNYHLGSGFHYGGSFLTVSGDFPADNEAWAMDIQFLYLRYEICCNWYLNFDGRATQAKSNVQKVIGYNFGVGLCYVFNTRQQ